MLDDGYLEKGITALSRAGSITPMTGHTGAAVLAAYFFARESALDERATAALKQRVDALIATGGKSWFSADRRQDPGLDLFEPYPPEPSDPSLIQDIARALDPKIDRLQESGHCTIFASLALKALRHRPTLATPSAVGGVCRLLGLFGRSPGQGYYGAEKGWIKGVPVDPEDPPAPYGGTEDLVRAAFAELIGHDKIRRKGYGGLVHLFTHTNALAELSEMGYEDLARRGYAAHRQHIQLLRGLPPDPDDNGRPVPLRPTAASPLTERYWQGLASDAPAASALHLGGPDHAIKVSYAFFHLLPYAPDPSTRRHYAEQLGYLV